jgi:uncharacterized membrane protein YeaQ/YmgE (transglycosylase-associated protein family)
MLHVVSMFIVGIVVGAVARLLLPGAQHIGLVMTGVVGIAGSFVGGLLTWLFIRPAPGSAFHPAGFVMSVVGAVLLLYCWYHFGLSARLGL